MQSYNPASADDLRSRLGIDVPTSYLRLLLCGVLFCVVSLIASTPAQGIEALPGSTWGSVSYSAQGQTGTGFMGWINQGIDWTTLPGGITLNTYAEYRYRSQTENKDYFNAQGPVLGLEFRKWFLRLGTDYYWEVFPDWPGGGMRSNNHEYYLAGYYNWDVSKLSGMNSSKIVGLPGSIWFNLTYDAKGLTGSGSMGWINQGIDWVTLPGGIVFDTYVEYRYRSQTKQKEYYNAYGPVVGLEFKKSFFRLGADYYWRKYPEWPVGGQRTNYLEFYLTWYVDWDLKKKTQ